MPGILTKKKLNTFKPIHYLCIPKRKCLDQIDENVSSISYVSFEEAVIKIKVLGNIALLSKSFNSGFCFEHSLWDAHYFVSVLRHFASFLNWCYKSYKAPNLPFIIKTSLFVWSSKIRFL